MLLATILNLLGFAIVAVVAIAIPAFLACALYLLARGAYR